MGASKTEGALQNRDSLTLDYRGAHGQPLNDRVIAAQLPPTLTDAIQALAGVPNRGLTVHRSTREKRDFSFASIHSEAVRHARLLETYGMSKGDRVVLVLINEDDVVFAFLGAVLAGFVPVVVNPRTAIKPADGFPSPLAAIVRNCGARMIVTSSNLADVIGHLQRTGHLPEQVLYVDQWPAARATGESLIEFVPARADPDDLCFLQYTSGTTRQPHGVMITHRNLMANAAACLATTLGDANLAHSAVSWLPLYHDFGLIGFFLAPLVGQYPITMFSPALFARRPSLWLELLHECRASTTGAPNFAFSFMLRRLRGIDLSRFDLSGLGVLFCGGEPINYEALAAFAEWLAPTGFDRRCIVPAYGLAEATLAVSLHPVGSPIIADRISRAGSQEGRAEPASRGESGVTVVSCGRPISFIEAEITDEAGKPVAERTIGEIRLRGPTVSAHYFGEMQASDTAWRGGWLYTGDLGYFADGNLFICGRSRDLIIVRGINYYPQDIEWTVERMNDFRGRSVAAFATLRDGEEGVTIIAECPIVAAERHRTLRAAMAAAIMHEHGLIPQDIRFVPLGSLPLTSSGKIRRGLARKMYEAGQFDGTDASEPAPQSS